MCHLCELSLVLGTISIEKAVDGIGRQTVESIFCTLEDRIQAKVYIISSLVFLCVSFMRAVSCLGNYLHKERLLMVSGAKRLKAFFVNWKIESKQKLERVRGVKPLN